MFVCVRACLHFRACEWQQFLITHWLENLNFCGVEQPLLSGPGPCFTAVFLWQGASPFLSGINSTDIEYLSIFFILFEKCLHSNNYCQPINSRIVFWTSDLSFLSSDQTESLCGILSVSVCLTLVWTDFCQRLGCACCWRCCGWICEPAFLLVIS